MSFLLRAVPRVAVRALLGGAVIAAFLLGLADGARADETCVTCHRQQRDPRLRQPPEQLPDSVHGQHGMTCTGCHGGDPEMASVRAHLAPGFRPRVAVGTSAAVCGDCHADAQRMAEEESDNPTDQLEQYQGSVHAQAFARGNDRAATCSRCHGSHNIRPVDHPDSPVHPSRVASTCGACHSDAVLMESLGMAHDQELQWQNSVHGRAHAQWVEATGGDRESTERHPPTCNDCHMDHGVKERETAIYGCATCHEDEWESFAAGPHEEAFDRIGFLPCVDCHGSHEIAPIDPSFIGIDREATCRRCHAEGQEMFETIREVAAGVREAEVLAQDAKRALSGVSVAEIEIRLRPVDEALHALRVAVHTLNPEEISTAAQALSQAAGPIIASRPPEPEEEPENLASWLPSMLVLGVALVAFGLWYTRRRGQP